MAEHRIRRKRNYVQLGVTFPDGCYHTHQMNATCEEARDVVKFAAFLVKLGKEIHDRATTQGRCAVRQ